MRLRNLRGWLWYSAGMEEEEEEEEEDISSTSSLMFHKALCMSCSG